MLKVGHLYSLKYPINVGHRGDKYLTDTIFPNDETKTIMALVGTKDNVSIFLLKDTIFWTYAGGICFKEIK